MPSIRTIATINAQAVQLIRQGQYNDAQTLLDQGLNDLDDCESLCEEKSRECSIELQAFVMKRRPVKQDSAFVSYEKVFLFLTPSSSSGLDQENDSISDCEFEFISSVLWYNIGMAAMLSKTISAEMVPARYAFERALEHLNEFDFWSSSTAVLFRLAVMNNTGYTTYVSAVENADNLDEREAMDRLDQVNQTLLSSIHRGPILSRCEIVVFLYNIHYHRDRTSITAALAA